MGGPSHRAPAALTCANAIACLPAPPPASALLPLTSQERRHLLDSCACRHLLFRQMSKLAELLGQERSAHHARSPHDSTTTDKSLQGAEQCLAGMLEELPHLADWPQLSDRVLKVVQELVKAVGKKLTAPSGGGAEKAARSLHKSMQLLLGLLQLLPSLVSLRLHKPAVEALHNLGWQRCSAIASAAPQRSTHWWVLMHSYAPPPNTPCLQKDAFDLGVLLACGGDVQATSLWRQAGRQRSWASCCPTCKVRPLPAEPLVAAALCYPYHHAQTVPPQHTLCGLPAGPRSFNEAPPPAAEDALGSLKPRIQRCLSRAGGRAGHTELQADALHDILGGDMDNLWPQASGSRGSRCAAAACHAAVDAKLNAS